MIVHLIITNFTEYIIICHTVKYKDVFKTCMGR